METIDLREKARSCTEHPLIRLQKKLKSMKSGDRIRVFTDAKTIPVGVLEIMAEKHGVVVHVVREDHEVVEAELSKK